MKKYLTRQSQGIRCESNVLPDGDEMYSDDRGHAGEAWNLDVGADCNRLLALAHELEHGGKPTATYNADAQAIRSIVARVGQFEELETE